MKPGVYQFLIGCFASLGSVLFGYDLGVIAEAVASSSFKERFLQSDADARSGTVVALFTGGCFVGSFAAGFADRLGRRGTILLACGVFTVGGVIQTAGVDISMLYIGRLLAGIGVGLLTMVVPIYQAEISHRRIRGRITSLQQLFDAVGQILATWICYGCYVVWDKEKNSAEWRVPLGIQIVPAIFLASFVYMIPESPRWLCDHDQWERGLETLAQLHAHGDIHDPYVIAEYNLIEAHIRQEHTHRRKTYFDLFKDWPNIRRTILVMAAQASTQMTGVSAIRYFSPQIFAQIGIPTATTLLLTGVQAIIAFLGTSICILVIDSIGRRPLQIGGNMLMACTFAVNCALIKVFPPTSTSTPAHWTFVAMTWFFSFIFFITSGPLSWALPVEFFGTALRSKGVAVGAMTSFAFNTMIGQVTPIAISSIGWRYYLIFIITNTTNAIFFWAFLPETKGLNLEDMDELFFTSKLFVPGSSWTPTSHVDADAKKIATEPSEIFYS
ncbi:general substrate transporter [Aspergillus lucknowensis]|uniref:General substrate transporter n=1 Tax=Aspergillus lucknowensis TaxID=176173 RepID=A0ABR4LG02_9EURO